MKFITSHIDDNMGKKNAKSDKFALALLAQTEEKKFCNLCEIYRFCSSDIQALIEEELYKNWNNLDAFTLRMIVECGVFDYDEFIREAFIERIKVWNSKKIIDVVIKDNPLICMIVMSMYSIIRKSEIEKVEKFACNSKMLKFITQPSVFNVDDFNEDWKFLFRLREYKEAYEKMKQNKIDKEEEEARIARRKKYFG